MERTIVSMCAGRLCRMCFKQEYSCCWAIKLKTSEKSKFDRQYHYAIFTYPCRRMVFLSKRWKTHKYRWTCVLAFQIKMSLKIGKLNTHQCLIFPKNNQGSFKTYSYVGSNKTVAIYRCVSIGSRKVLSCVVTTAARSDHNLNIKKRTPFAFAYSKRNNTADNISLHSTCELNVTTFKKKEH